ncbi:MAG: hypothetical protein IJM76_09555 [Lachnospiraceae bacterium]|nr:hypothetical protein [Lachnospiraceae bacterium]
MAVKASAETIRNMSKEIRGTISDIQRISAGIKSGINQTADWNDAQSQQFKTLMGDIARLTEAPVQTLTAALPKLEKLAQALDQYSRVRF